MKKVLSFFLALALLLCALPIASVYAEGETEGADTPEGFGDYRDLYVKEGLVALFDAFGATAGTSNLSKWTALDLSGRADYPDYISPSAYSTKFNSGSNLYYKWGDGCLVSYHTSKGSERPGENFQLTSLFSLLGANASWSIQEVYQITGPSRAGNTPNIIVDEDGDHVITNYDSLLSGTSTPGSTGARFYGIATLGSITFSKAYTGVYSIPMINHYFQQLGYTDEEGTAHTTNVTFNTKWYLKNAALTPYYKYVTTTKTGEDGSETTLTEKTLVGSYYGGSYPAAVMEHTVSRSLNEEYTTDSQVAMDYTITWQSEPNKIGPSGQGKTRSFSFIATAAQDSATVKILGKRANVFGVRVYNRELTRAEIDQNHLADLCGFYGADASGLLALSAEQLEAVAAEMAYVQLSRDKYTYTADEYGGLSISGISEQFAADKQAFEAELAAAIGGALTEESATYLDVYVKEGLVALFDAHSAKASDEALTTWTPVDFYGKEGYNSYLDPSLYTPTLNGTWKQVNGALHSSYSGASFALSSLGALLGDTYSVQTVYGMTKPNGYTQADISVVTTTDESGKTTTKNVINNYTSLSTGAKTFGTDTYGLFSYKVMYYGQRTQNSGHYLMDSWFFQIAGTNWLPHGSGVATDNGVRNATYYYTDSTGEEKSFSAYHTNMPAHIQEITVSRGAATATDTGVSVPFSIYWQFYPNRRGGNAHSSHTYSWERTGTADSTTLTLLSGREADNFSVRAYNRNLVEAEIWRNHLADLFGFYSVDVSGLSFLGDAQIAELATAFATTKMIHNRYEADGVTFTADYYNQKKILQTAVNEAVLAELNSVPKAIERLLTFEGHSFRVSGNYGIRAVYSLSKEARAFLAEQGYELLSYGAVMAIGTYNGTVYNEDAASIVVTVDAEGKAALADGIRGAALLNSTDEGFKTLSDTEEATRFAYTTTYNVDSAAALYALDMLYRGYVVLRDDAGAVSVHYCDVPEGDEDKNSLAGLHASVIEEYGYAYYSKYGISAFDYLYDVLETVDSERYNDAARAAARRLAENYNFDSENIVLTFGALSDTHVTTATKANRLKNMMKVFSNTYGVDAILFGGDLSDRLNNESFTAAQFKTGYTDLSRFAEAAAAGNIGNVPLIWTLGNHDRPHVSCTSDVSFTSPGGKSYTIASGTTLTEGFIQVLKSTSEHFMVETEGAPTGIRYQDVKGFAFFAIDYTFADAESVKWIDAKLTELEKSEPDKPIFITSHMPTDNKSQNVVINKLLEKHHNVVYLSGHTHATMQSYSSITERDGFLEIVLGPGSHASYGISGSGYTYNSYEMKQGAVIEVDANGNIRVRCLDMNFNVEEDGSVTTLFTKGGDSDVTAATNPYVVRTAYFSSPDYEAGMKVVYDSVPRYTTDPRYEAPSFDKDSTLSVTDVAMSSLNLLIPKASATNFIRYYGITLKDADGNVIKLFDTKASTKLTAKAPSAVLLDELLIASDFICHTPYDEKYPDPYIYNLPLTYRLTTTDDTDAVLSTEVVYLLEEGKSYTVSVVAYDDFGQSTAPISASFTVPVTDGVSLDGKSVIFIGNSFLYYGNAVTRKDNSVLTQSARENDTGYFYQICKENGMNVSVTNWTFGSHGLHSLFGEDPCNVAGVCQGVAHESYLTNPVFDYVFVSPGSGSISAASVKETMAYLMNFFRSANPDVKIVLVGNHAAYLREYPEIYTYYKTLESEENVIIADWGDLVWDVMNGETEVGTDTVYTADTFIVSDGYHENPLAGYITALFTYCAVTGDSAVGQAYDFYNDKTLNGAFNMESYVSQYYTTTSSNFESVFASEEDMLALQGLIDRYLAERPYRNHEMPTE